MTSFYLRGERENQEKYITNFIQKHQIPSYLTMRFEAPFSIKSAHELGVFLSMAVGKTEKKMIIVPSDMSIEAQNSLLKKIEELDENTFLFVTEFGGQEVLPTVLSRLFEIRMNDKDGDPDVEIIQRINDILQNKNDVSSILQNAKFFSEYKGDSAREVIRALRNALLEEQDVYAARVLEKIIINLELYLNNNIHKRIFWDNVFLQSL